MTTLEQDVSVALRILIREDHHRGLLSAAINVRRLNAAALRLRDGSLELAEVSGTGREVGPRRPRLVTIEEALKGAPAGDGSSSAQSVRRKVRRWAEQGLVTAELHGKTWLVDPDEVHTRLSERRSA